MRYLSDVPAHSSKLFLIKLTRRGVGIKQLTDNCGYLIVASNKPIGEVKTITTTRTVEGSVAHSVTFIRNRGRECWITLYLVDPLRIL
jgi:hypothetical protein